MGRLENKVALITGVASGIGLATAQRFAEEGALIAGLDLNTPGGPAWEKIRATAKGCSFYTADVSNEKDVKSAVAAAKKKFGRIDVLVNCAGVPSVGTAEDTTMEEWDRIMNINLKGSFLVAKYVARIMLKQQSGSIVHIASIEGLEGFSGQVVYGVSKAGVIQMTRAMAADYATQGIRVNCVCPGVIDTPFSASLNDESLKDLKKRIESAHLMQRFGKPVEIANGILFLASDEASFVTGQALVIDGGWTAGNTILNM